MMNPWMFAWLAREREFEFRRELEWLRRYKESRKVCQEAQPAREIWSTIFKMMAGWFRQRPERIPADKCG